MKLGIDFGTTRIVVAAADRGNYPILTFDSPDGAWDWFPPLVALRGGERLYGWEAWARQAEAGWTIVRSLKRALGGAGADTALDIDGVHHGLLDLLTGMAGALRGALSRDEPLDAMLGVPANANSNQRFLTVEAFRLGGFNVIGLLNEPSAAAIEFGHSQKLTGKLLVYDLGGGTFDASLVELDEKTHTVLASGGIATLGGDDFDHLLAELAVGDMALTAAELFRLHEECRRQKEALHPNSRRMVIDLDQVREGLGQPAIPVAAFYERARPLIDETIHAVADLLGAQTVEALYVTGGGSELPLVARMLKEKFGRRVRRSAYTRSATAIGLAIQADAASGYVLREMFTRNFGVWREGEAGREKVFDTIFPRGTRLPGPHEAPLEVRRHYQPAHNVGHFRFLEASHLAGGQPAGDIALWDEILFPFDPELEDKVDLNMTAVEHSERAGAQHIEERFVCDVAGGLTVEIRNLTSQHQRDYKLGRWAAKAATATTAPKRRGRR